MLRSLRFWLLPLPAPLRTGLALAIGSALLLHAPAASAYFVRPFITFGPGQSTDGLIVDGATSNSVQFNDAARTSRSFVDLETGEMKIFALGAGSTTSASGQGVMGDTLTFKEGAGTQIFFDFSLEALIDAEVLADTPGQNSVLRWNVAIAVFETGLVDHTNFFGNALQDDPGDIAPLFFQQDGGDLGNPSEDISGFEAFASVEGALLLPDDDETYDFFYLAAVAGISNEELNFFALDGEQTATASIDVDPDVDVSSGSGVFLGFPQTVPEPTSALLMASVLLGLLQRVRSTRAASRPE